MTRPTVREIVTGITLTLPVWIVVILALVVHP